MMSYAHKRMLFFLYNSIHSYIVSATRYDLPIRNEARVISLFNADVFHHLTLL